MDHVDFLSLCSFLYNSLGTHADSTCVRKVHNHNNKLKKGNLWAVKTAIDGLSFCTKMSKCMHLT